MAVEMIVGIGGEMVRREIPDTNKYSKLKVVKELKARGVWKQVKDKLVETDNYDLFLMAQYFEGSDPDFKAGMDLIAAMLGWGEGERKNFLENCKDAE